MRLSPRFSRLAGIALAAVAGAACQPKVVNYAVQIVVTACQSPAPLEGATTFRVRVSGEGINPPLEATSSVSSVDREIKIPEIPAGRGRLIEVRAYAGDPGPSGKLVAIGRSLPFEVPDVVPENNETVQISVFLRRVNAFTPPSSILSPQACSRLITARAGHTATLLNNGKVYIAGGYSIATAGALKPRTALTAAEFYNPATGAFEDAPKLGLVNANQFFTPLAKAFHTSTLLANGQVLVWGGEEYGSGDNNGDKPTPRGGVLIFDADQNSYGGVPFQNLSNIGRSRHAAVREASGKVLILGGVTTVNKTLTDKVEWYDPATTIAKVVDGVPMPRIDMSVSAVQGARYIAVAGGSDGTKLLDEVSFFEFTGTGFALVQTQQPPRLKETRRAAGVATLRDSQDVLLVGGYNSTGTATNSSEIVSTGSSFNVADGPPVSSKRGDICATLLPDGRVLAIGGRAPEDAPATGFKSDTTVELIIPQASGSPSVLGKESLKVGRYHHTCTTLADGSVLVLGGVREAGTTLEVLQDALIFTPEPLDL